MDLSILIVTYNQFEKAKICLSSIYASHLSDLSFEVILVDNASTQGDANIFKDAFPEIKIIKSPKNLGMGAGNNLAFQEAKGQYLLILNPDTELHTEAIKTMLNYLKDNKQCGMVGPKLIYPDGEGQLSCYRFPSLLMPFIRRTMLGKFNKKYLDNYLMKDANLNEIQKVDWLMGSCLILSSDLFRKLNGFDERFFMYFEDTDLSKRIHTVNLDVIYLPTAKVIHHHGRASARQHWLVSIFTNRMARIHLISYLKYFQKWGFFS